MLGVVRAAEHKRDISLISSWYGYLALQLASFADDLDPLLNDPSLAEFVTSSSSLTRPITREHRSR